MTHPSAFKSPEDEAAYRAGYDATLKLWPVPYEEIETVSRFGITHIVASGPQDGPPLVLLHGFMNTLMMWLPNVADFSDDFRVYAIDIMGHPSKSIPDEPIGDAADFTEWLSATFDGLGLEEIYLAGISFGGWLGLNLAMTEPQRIKKLVLLSPAASFQPLATQFTLRAVLSGIIPVRRTMDSLMKWLGLEAGPGDTLTQSVLDLIWLGGKHFQIPPETRRAMPTVFDDDDLCALQLPVLLLIGEQEVIYNPAEALDRARRLIPNLDGELVPDANHAMSFTHHEIVDARVLAFLNGN